MTRLPEGAQPRTTGTLAERTERIIKQYDMEDKDYAFCDSGDAESYAAEMADLLEQWAEVHRASMARHPAGRQASQEPDDIYTPDVQSIEKARRQRRRQGDWP